MGEVFTTLFRLNPTYWYSSSPDTLITRTSTTPNKLITWSYISIMSGQNINFELSFLAYKEFLL